MKKIFVIDTNVILHDFRSVFNFDDNDIVIPITVLEELDRFKKGNDLINFHAREFTREIDKLSGKQLFNEGVPLGEGKGYLFVETGKEYSDEMKKSFSENIPDHKILAVADYIRRKNPKKKVIFVTQDVNLRLKAKSLGIPSEDYETGKVQNLEAIYRNIQTIENIDDELINRLYKEYEGVSADCFPFFNSLYSNQYFILKGNKSSALAHFDKARLVVDRVEKQQTYGITPRNAEQTFAIDALIRQEIQLVALTGKAGTGKTLLALAAALYQRQVYNQIFLARPIVPLANKDLGYLPGDVNDKIDPYMQPLYDNLAVIKNCFDQHTVDYKRIEEMQKAGKLIITPLAYIRGRSLSKIFFIVDEAQNLTPHEIKTIITRAGEGTKLVFTGDIEQIDSPYLDSKSNGLSYLSDKMKGEELFAHINLVRGERSALADLASRLL